MQVESKLRAFRAKIEQSSEINKEFGDLVGIEFFDFIHEQSNLWSETEARVQYLHLLAAAPSFNLLQDLLYESINKILKELSLVELKKVQKRWANAWYNPLRRRPERNPDWVELPELHKLFSDKSNYYRLGDEDVLSNYGGHDIPFSPRTEALHKQYDKFEEFLRLMQVSEVLRAKWGDKIFLKSLESYNDARHEFNDLTQARPIKLHVAAFVRFFYFAMAVYSRKGYEDWYKWQNPNLYDKKYNHISNDVKKDILTVIDDLLETQSKIITPIIGGAEPINVGQLSYTADGRITFRGTNIILRPQLKTLLILFMQSHKSMIDYSSIKDELIRADKRRAVKGDTIQKYVSALHVILKKHFKREVIFNVDSDGYMFNTEISSMK